MIILTDNLLKLYIGEKAYRTANERGVDVVYSG